MDVESREVPPGVERFAVEDLRELAELVGRAWSSVPDGAAAWAQPAGSLEWSCLRTADHAVDCVYAPAFFLASRQVDDYPIAGSDLRLGGDATPTLLVRSLSMAVNLLAGVVRDAPPDARAAIFRRPSVLVGRPEDFVPRAGLELALHAFDVCTGLSVPFEPPAPLCRRLREHTRGWPMWTMVWEAPGHGDDPWRDLLVASARR